MVRSLWRFFGPGVLFVGLLWLIKGYELLADTSLAHLALRPRAWRGLAGIVTMPLLHADVPHLVSNSAALVGLGGFLWGRYPKIAWEVVGWLYLATGVWTWALGQPYTTHLGASGLVYGLAFFTFFSGVFRRDRSALALALLVAFLYGGLWWGLLPLVPNVSWEGHLSGAVAGTGLAYYFARRARPAAPAPRRPAPISFTPHAELNIRGITHFRYMYRPTRKEGAAEDRRVGRGE